MISVPGLPRPFTEIFARLARKIEFRPANIVIQRACSTAQASHHHSGAYVRSSSEKEVVPIAQSRGDIPSDLNQHLAPPYLTDGERRGELLSDLSFEAFHIQGPLAKAQIATKCTGVAGGLNLKSKSLAASP